MEKSREVIEVLNDLVMINSDRIAGYQRAIKELKPGNEDLKLIFDRMIIESQQIKSDLANEILVLHGDVEEGTSEMGKIYRAWMEVKAVFTGESRHKILSNCEIVGRGWACVTSSTTGISESDRFYTVHGSTTTYSAR